MSRGICGDWRARDDGPPERKDRVTASGLPWSAAEPIGVTMAARYGFGERSMASNGFTRRHFFYGTLLAGAVPAGGFGSTPSLKALGYKSPNEKLNIASIGAGGKAASDIHGCAPTENIVALCDVDDKQAAAIYKEFEKPPKYKDFRKMLDKEGGNIDAVIVTIPDHMHATAAIHCMERGKHVYTQKPLVRTIKEARMMVEAANKYKVATQMGNQGYSNEGTR